MRSVLLIALLVALSSCSHTRVLQGDASLNFPGEKHFRNIRQLTFGGTNAEAYWSFSGEWLSFQRTGPEGPGCDQIYRMRWDGSDLARVSDGKGRTTCAFHYPDDSRILFSTTSGRVNTCPPAPDKSRGYVWPIYASYQIASAQPDGTDVIPLEPGAPRAYNAEATVCKDGSVVFTSDRDGDLELYVGKLDKLGTINEVKRITKAVGYDGGAVFSPDCKQLVWRASRPKPGRELEEYQALLAEHLVKPTQMELWIGNADGSHSRQLTRIGAASFAPAFTPDGKRVIFSSNPRDPKGRRFDLYMITTQGTRLERVSFSDTFDSFPMFSPDGRFLAFSSNRNGKSPRETNVFITEWAEWVDEDAPPRASMSAADRFLANAAQLSATEMEGRGVGTEGLRKAEAWVEAEFRSLGMQPFLDGSFRHEVEMVTPEKAKHTHANVIGALGKDCGKRPAILIGAHLDHLGYGGHGSLEVGMHVVHPGADDNASGVAAMLEIARLLKKRQGGCFVFAAFTGEEIGTAGSSRLAETLRKKGLLPKAMFDLDMLGRLEQNKLIAFGSDSALEWRALLDKHCAAKGLTCTGGGDGYGPSDHMPFYIAKVPVLHFFTGPHADYHRAGDTAEKLNATGAIHAAELIADVAAEAAVHRLTYKKAARAPVMGLVRGKSGKGSGAYLGTIPDYASLTSPEGPGGGGEPSGGVKLAGVRPGSPADKAGVIEGDVLVGIGVQPVRTLQEFTNVLSELTPGQSVDLRIQRSGKPMVLRATVGKRE